jgi:hypothetical protein
VAGIPARAGFCSTKDSHKAGGIYDPFRLAFWPVARRDPGDSSLTGRQIVVRIAVVLTTSSMLYLLQSPPSSAHSDAGPVASHLASGFIPSDRPPSIESAGTRDRRSTNPCGKITCSPNGQCSGDFCWYYVGGSEPYVKAKAASASFTQADPVVSSTDYHSLTEIAVMTQNEQQIVELGWTVAPEQFGGDTLPYLFVYHWVNGESTCYNACGYVSLVSPNPVGAPVSVGPTGTFEINYSKHEWQIIYNGTLIGYFPESLWGGSFTRIGEVQVYGEVSAPAGVPPTSQMGNGILGSQPGAAQIEAYRLIDSHIRDPKLFPFVYGNPESYFIGNIERRSVTYGGPGGF